jgi:serine protease DegS
MKKISLINNLLYGLSAVLVAVALGLHYLPDTNPEVNTVQLVQAADAGIPSNGPVSYSQAVKAAAPAVVNINTTKVVTVRSHPFFSDPVFQQFFGDMIVNGTQNMKRVENSLGSGVIVSPQGYVLTNNHVIKGADSIQVSLKDGRSVAAEVIGTDAETDIALLRIDLDQLPTIRIGESDALEIGDVVLAIGNPFGVGQTVTMGIVSATGRNQLGINTFENFIQTDAAINPGNSGGALIDANGNLIGINTAIFSKSGGSQGIGFAIPSRMATSVMQQLIEHGHTIRGWIGFEGHALNEKLARSLDIESSDGVIVTGIVRNSPAHEAGLEPGDIIRSIDGKKIINGRDALLIITAKKPGEEITLDVVRNNQPLSITAVTVNRPEIAVESLK